ncbi:MAG TPA: ParB/RepB/Spo0J family partition protein [Thermoanaerobaculaceae bacterium]|nr:ParB/RepB/Spo0J family partition protein [Thermoanaerobaculaceae bacterium]
MKRSALGKGIAALIPEAPHLRSGAGAELPVAEIEPNPLQPRRQFDKSALAELVASIKAHGLLQPVVVSRAPGGGYHLIAGERRWRAAKLAGLERIPALLREESGDADRLALALIENLQREDLTPIEEARAYHHLRTELGLSQEEIAGRVGKERSTIANALRLLQLPLEVQELVDAGTLSAGHARAVVGVQGRERQIETATRCVKRGWSVRELERSLQKPSKRERTEPDPETRAAEDRLALALGVKVEIKRRRRGGEVRLMCQSEEDLIRVFRMLTRGSR